MQYDLTNLQKKNERRLPAVAKIFLYESKRNFWSYTMKFQIRHSSTPEQLVSLVAWVKYIKVEWFQHNNWAFWNFIVRQIWNLFIKVEWSMHNNWLFMRLDYIVIINYVLT